MVESLESNDTFKGFEGGSTCRLTSEHAQDASEASDKVAGSSNAQSASQPDMVTVGVGGDDDVEPVSVGTDTADLQKNKPTMTDIGVETDVPPPPPKAPPTKPAPPPLPKAVYKLTAKNEDSQIVDADKLVHWERIMLNVRSLENILEVLAGTEHVKKRVPCMQQIIQAVDLKLEDPAMQRMCFQNNLDKQEARCMMAYTWDNSEADKRGCLFRELNVDLRMLSTLNGSAHEALRDLWAPFLRRMMTGMRKMPRVQQKKLWRGRPESVEEMKQTYSIGREVIWSSYSSCTLHKEFAAYMASWHIGTVLEINVVLPVHDISSISFFPTENEVLLPPNTKLVVVSEPRIERLVAGDGSEWDVQFIELVQTGATQLIS